MLENKVSCDEVLNQISLKICSEWEAKLILNHRNCVVNDIKAGEENVTISELVYTLNKMIISKKKIKGTSQI